jgi:hypothetical protein
MDLLVEQSTKISELPPFQDVSIIRVNCEKLKRALLPSPLSCLAAIHKLLPEIGAGGPPLSSSDGSLHMLRVAV